VRERLCGIIAVSRRRRRGWRFFIAGAGEVDQPMMTMKMSMKRTRTMAERGGAAGAEGVAG